MGDMRRGNVDDIYVGVAHQGVIRPVLVRNGEAFGEGVCRRLAPGADGHHGGVIEKVNVRGHMLDERPWSDDWQNRLVRNEPSLLRFPGVLHSSAELVAPYRYVESPIYHLDCVLRTRAEREDKAERYRQIRSEHKTEDGIPVNDFYLPELRTAPALLPVPEEDGPRILEAAEVLSNPRSGNLRTEPSRDWRVPSELPPVVSFEEIDRHWACRAVSPSAYHARMELVEPLDEMRAGEVRSVLVRVRNEGDETWPWGERQPEIRLGHRWFSRDGETLVKDGARTTFSANVAQGASSLQKMTVVAPASPGGYLLELNVLHEHVAWFDGALRIAVSVTDNRESRALLVRS